MAEWPEETTEGAGSPPYRQPARDVPNYLVPAVLTTIFCCLPVGAVAIFFAAQVNSRLDAGDIAGAREASRRARTWAIVAAVAGVAAFALVFAFILFLVPVAVEQQAVPR